ncbi:MAG: alpha/beta hydrolase [Planctomycetota bacterium]
MRRTNTAAALLAASGVLHSGCALPTSFRLASPEEALVYQPSGSWAGEIETPRLDPQDITIITEDDVALHGWYCPVENPQAVVLFAHGNAGAVPQRWPRLRWLNEQLNVSVLAFDYRGYGRSEGRPSEAGLIADAQAASYRLASLAGVEVADVVLYGRSLGGAVMVQLAAEQGARGVILESTFTSLPEVADHKLPLLSPGRWMQNEFDSLSRIAEYRGPLLIAHGEKDKLAPADMGRRLFAAANEPKRFYAEPFAGHNWTPTEGYRDAMVAFFDSLPAGPSGAGRRGRDVAKGPAILDQTPNDADSQAAPARRVAFEADEKRSRDRRSD